MNEPGLHMKTLPNLRTLIVALLAIWLANGTAHAVEPDEILKDPALEARARQLSTGLRCLVCQNQSIDDSNAPLARDLRVLVRERLKQGDSDAAVLEFVVARYGTFVLLRPPFSAGTLLLWLTPLLLLTGGMVFAYRLSRKRQETPIPVSELTAEERAHLARILDKPS